MKKYLFGLTAIVLAIFAVAFTSPKKAMFTDVYFEYQGPNFTETEVEKQSNWVEVSSSPGLDACDNVNEAACRIKVDHTVTQGSAPSRTLISDPLDPNKADLIAAPFGSAPNITYYITVAGDVLARKNNVQ